eukprot:GFUD01019751.1.p1 GENE.GFUD01019751.1~~GFUD01019751.1.p1  ORF type:complete len:800 (-),score=175.20 GFUD01019751.1:41-2440(-)
METRPCKARSRLFSSLSCRSQVQEYQSFCGLEETEGVLLEKEQELCVLSNDVENGHSHSLPHQHPDASASKDPPKYSEIVTDLQKVLNNKEASIYLEEGADFEPPHPPWDRSVLTMLLLLHRKWLYSLDLLAAIFLLLLGLCESPCLPSLELQVVVHTGLEVGCLTVIMLVLLLKIRTRWRTVWSQRRDLAKLGLILVLLVEAVVVMVRKKPHWRLTRALRPVFLVENHFMSGLRRFLRQLVESLPPILDIMGLMLFMITIYSVLGFYLLGPTKTIPGSPYFQSLTDSMVNLFVLLTTANFPDIMMPSYADNMWYSAFFMSYLGINLYFFMNLMLTVVYKTFADIEEKKFKSLLAGKAEAATRAFNLLKSRETGEVEFSSFKGLMKEYQPFRSDIDILLMWKYLLRSSSNPAGLSSAIFSNVYEATTFQWCLDIADAKNGVTSWYTGTSKVLARTVTSVRQLVTSQWFEFGVYGLVGVNATLLVVQAALIETTDQDHLLYNSTVGMVFMLLYSVEVLLKVSGLGVRGYLACPWNVFDLIVTTTSIISMGLVFTSYSSEDHMSTIVILRLVRVLRLFRMKKRFRDVFGTALILLPHLVSTVIVLQLLYYFFAIIGMELFSSYDLTNCCKGSPIESFYFHHPDPNDGLHGFYFLNNFHSLPQAGVTLFELTVVNNWSIIMEAHVTVTGSGWTRLYFITFYLFTLVVLTIVVAAVLEAFLFRIQYKKALKKEDESVKLKATVSLTVGELSSLSSNLASRVLCLLQYSLPSLEKDSGQVLSFRGNKRQGGPERNCSIFCTKLE